jgi:hypothetical protein
MDNFCHGLQTPDNAEEREHVWQGLWQKLSLFNVVGIA